MSITEDAETRKLFAKGRLPYIHPRLIKLINPAIVKEVLAIQEPEVELVQVTETGYWQTKAKSASTFWRHDFIHQFIIGADMGAARALKS